MAFTQEVIETEPQREPKPVLGSKRPIVFAVVALVILISLALWMSTGSGRKPSASVARPTLLVPDRESAAQLQRESQAARRTKAVPSAQPTTPYPGDRLLVTDSVPRLADSKTGEVVPGTPGAGFHLSPVSSAGSLMASQQANFNQYAMELQKSQLDMSRDALTSSSRVKAFEDARKQSEDQAMQMLEKMGGSAGQDNPFMQAAGPSLAMLAARAGAPGVSGTGTGSMLGPTAGGSDPHMSQQKLAFFREGGQQLEPAQLGSAVRQQQTPYELKMGAIIPGILITGINSESPGQILGQVSENVYDSATGRHLLFPQGSGLVGTYSAFVAQGQTRVQIAWVRLNMPNGASLDLGGMQGADQAGVSGFRDRVNRHFWRRLAAALLTTSFAVGYEVTAPQNGGQLEGAVHRGVGESLVQLGADMARQESQIPPTLEIRAGYRFSIMVNKDIKFPGAYEDGIDRRVHRGRR